MPTTIISTASCSRCSPPILFPSLPFPNPNRLLSPGSPVRASPFSNHDLLPLLHCRAAAPLLSFGIHKTSICRQISPSLAFACHSLPDTDSVWEAPDYGSDSDDENEEHEKEEGSYYAEKTAQVIHYEEKLRKEVELLLSPEERAILQHNVTAALDKIATTKWIPLHTLALSLQIPFMDKLIESGLDVDVADKDGYTALHKAIICKKEAVISHLLRKGANPHVRDKDGATPLHYAVLVGAIQTVKLLIKYEVDVNVADNEGWTPLHVAIQARCRDIAKFLLVNGADKTRRNKDGKLPLDLSLCYGRDFKSYELAKLLKVVPVES